MCTSQSRPKVQSPPIAPPLPDEPVVPLLGVNTTKAKNKAQKRGVRALRVTTLGVNSGGSGLQI